MQHALRNALVILLVVGSAQAAERPNVLWLTCEDISSNLGCYGDDIAVTPRLDQLARRGVRYANAIGITGVCAVNRSCLISGVYSSSLGSQDMRSRIQLPDHIKCFPEYLRSAGYYCTNNSKTDYNFSVPKNAWDACSKMAHWKNRKTNQPFFAVFNYVGTHESQIWEQNHKKHAAKLKPHEFHDPADVPIPPFHPDIPETRRDWANYYDIISALDHWIAGHLQDLDDAGLAGNTIVMFFSDHGAGMPGVKKWIWEGGLRVPFIVRFPSKYRESAPAEPGTATDRLVSFVDFAPTVLSLCGVDIPEHMQGKPFLGSQAVEPRDAAYVIRDRMAERYDTVRGVRVKQFQYYRNFMPHLPWSQYTSYTEQMPTMQAWRKLHQEGRLDPIQDRYFQPKPTEELYDLENDPHMIHNLAPDPKHQRTLERLRSMTRRWQIKTLDLGLIPEYVLHKRSQGTTPYELREQLGRAYFERLQQIAARAGDRDAANLQSFISDTTDRDEAIRWWAVMGLVMLEREAEPARSELQKCLTDDSPIVRIAAAEALCNLGDRANSIPTIAAELTHETPFVRLRAVNALDRLGDLAGPILDQVRLANMPPKSIFPADYLNRICEYLPQQRTFDVVVYGGTSAAVIAAVEAKRSGKSVVIVSPDKHLGGLTSGGLGWTDTGNKAVIGGLAREFYHRVWKKYQDPAAWKWERREAFGNKGQGTPAIDGKQRTMWIFEPHVAEQVFEDLVREQNIPVYRGEWLDRRDGVQKSDGRIGAITTLAKHVYRGRIFIDATYEGDLMAAAGVKYSVGREPQAKYGEQWNGIQVGVLHHRHHFGVLKKPIDPYRTPGDSASGVLPRISSDPPGDLGLGDKKIQAYCFRMCLTDQRENRVPFPKPINYDASQYQLLVRILDAGWRETFSKFDPIPNHKTDTNNHGPFSTDNIGRNYDYPEATYERRREIIQEHKDYQQGLMYFLANDPRVPDDVQQAMQMWGLAKDEFVDTGNWPHQLYVRESRRMVGHYVMTENELLKRRPTPRSIGMGSYTMDSHNVQRYITPAGHVQNEGDIGVSTKGPYQIAFGSILPKKSECQNLLVPVCVSSSHIAFGSIRMEPVFMILGQSAAAAALLAIDNNQAVQDVDFQQLKRRLLTAGQILEVDADKSVVLENKHLRIVFDAETGRLKQLIDVATSHDLVDKDALRGDLWRILVDDNEQQRVITPKDAKSFSWECPSAKEDLLHLTWSGFPLGDAPALAVTATVRLDPSQPNSHWHIAVESAASTTIVRTEFPRIHGIREQKNERLAVPIWMGQELANPRSWLCPKEKPGRRWACSYPGFLSMQCVAFYKQDGPGLYFASNDTNVLRKTFAFWGDDKRRVNFETWNYTLKETDDHSLRRLPYDIVVGTFVGDWTAAAERYRTWGVQQHWAKQSRLSQGLVPEWITGTALWIWNRGRSSGVLPHAVAFRKKMDLPVSVFWHWWHGCPYDIGFPEYLPPREGTESFRNAVAQAHDNDLKMIVYMNQRAWGLSTESWKREGAERFAVKDKKGNIHREVYNTFTRDALVPMCLATPFWRNKYAGLAEQAVNDLGVDGIYMDQACSQMPCFDPSHDHPPGGGDSWIHGFRQLSTDIRNRCKQHGSICLSGEGCGEAWLPYLDVMLALQVSRERYSSLTDNWEPIPFFHAVYHQHGITYGNYSSLTMPPYDELWPAESAPKRPLELLDRKFSQQFYLEQARTFVWGQQTALANFRTEHLLERPKETDYVVRLAQVRDRSRKFLLYGEFLRPPTIDVSTAAFDFSRLSIYAGQHERLTSRQKQYPLALAGAWRSPDGNVAIAVASISEKPLPVALGFDTSVYGLDGHPTVHRVDHTGRERLESATESDGNRVTLEFELPPLAIWVLELNGS